MKKLFTLLFIISAIVASKAQVYQLTVASSSISWTGYGEIGNFSQQGQITPKGGTLQMSEGQITAAQLIIDMHSIDHQDKKLKKHLKNKDFFYVKKYPESTLEMIQVEDGVLTANLTIRGITKTIKCPLHIQIDKNLITIEGQLRIDRTQFDIKYNSSSFFQDLGNYAIKNEFDLSFILQFKS